MENSQPAAPVAGQTPGAPVDGGIKGLYTVLTVGMAVVLAVVMSVFEFRREYLHSPNMASTGYGFMIHAVFGMWFCLPLCLLWALLIAGAIHLAVRAVPRLKGPWMLVACVVLMAVSTGIRWWPMEYRHSLVRRLGEAILAGDLRAVERALDAGAKVNEVEFNSAPLVQATRYLGPRYPRTNPEIVRLLLKRGADPNRQSGGLTALHCATQNNDLETVLVLLEGGADINIQDTRGDPPVHAAINFEHIEMVRFYVERGANLDLPNLQGETPRTFAVKRLGTTRPDIHELLKR